jgi:hypothetical protein
MAQYVSVVNRAYETSGLSPPGKAPNSTRLYIEVRKALDGFKRARLKAGGAEPVQHLPTPDLVIAGMCEFVRASLASPVTVRKLDLARCAMANIWQYFNFSRPTTTAALKWTDFRCINTSEVGFCLRRLAPGRKNRDAPTRHFTRRILSSETEPGLHPVSLFCAYRDAIRREVERRRLPMPVFVWQLPTEGVVANDMTSEKMNSWLRQAAKAAKIDLPVGLTAHCHRSGSATAAKKLQVDVAVFCQIADWDVGGKTFFDKYYRSNLKCTLALQRRFFADLLE